MSINNSQGSMTKFDEDLMLLIVKYKNKNYNLEQIKALVVSIVIENCILTDFIMSEEDIRKMRNITEEHTRKIWNELKAKEN